MKAEIRELLAKAYAIDVTKLLELTDPITGCSIVRINGYSSDKSNNTEVASQTINVGAVYANMVKKDSDIYANFDLNSVDVEKFNYDSIDTAKLTLDEFKQAVKDALPIALTELQAPKKSRDTSADIWLNKVVCFNRNTMRLSVLGQSLSKQVEQQGEFKKVKSAPKTVAKRLIEKQAKGRSASLRRFAIDNLVKSISVNKGEVIIE
jgi:hypothetical protein